MRPLHLAVDNIGPFTSMRLDFGNLDGTVVSVQGPNGSGKSTLFACVYAALYRDIPDKGGSIYDFCNKDRASIKLQFAAGSRLCEAEVRLNAKQRTMEAELRVDGMVVTNGKLDSFDAEVAKLCGDGKTALMTSFGAQNKAGSFLAMSRADRKSMMLKMLGCDDLMQVHEAAKERLKQLRIALATAQGAHEAFLKQWELDKLRLPEQSAKEARQEWNAALAERNRLMDRVARAEADLGAKNEHLAVLRAGLDRALGEEARLKDLKLALEREEAEHKALLEVDEGEGLAREKARKEAAVARIKLKEELALATRDCDEAVSGQGQYMEMDKQKAQLEQELVRMAALPSQIEAAQFAIGQRKAEMDKMKGAPTLEEANARMSDALLKVGEAHEALREAEGKRSEAQRAVVTLESELSQMEQSASHTDEYVEDFKKTTCLQNDDCPFVRRAREKLQAQEDLLRLVEFSKERLAKTKEDAAGREKAVSDATSAFNAALLEQRESELACSAAAQAKSLTGEWARLTAQLGNLERELAGREKAEKEYTSLVAQMGRLCPGGDYKKHVQEKADKASALRKQAEEAEKELQRIDERIAFCQDAEKKAAASAGRQEELKKQIEEASIRSEGVHYLQIQFETAELRKNQHEKDIASLKEMLKAAADEEQLRSKALWNCEHRLKQFKEDTAEIEKLGVKVSEAERDISVAKLLSEVTGPNWLQQDRLKAAVPAISALANELMGECFGGRFKLEFRFEEDRAAGNGMKTTFDMVAYNPKSGTLTQICDLSGGERVVVEECVSLAIALYHRNKGGKCWSALFRDEVAGALDSGAALQYLKAVRKAARIGGFEQAYFIAHNSELWAMADAQVLVRDGHATEV